MEPDELLEQVLGGFMSSVFEPIVRVFPLRPYWFLRKEWPSQVRLSDTGEYEIIKDAETSDQLLTFRVDVAIKEREPTTKRIATYWEAKDVVQNPFRLDREHRNINLAANMASGLVVQVPYRDGLRPKIRLAVHQIGGCCYSNWVRFSGAKHDT